MKKQFCIIIYIFFISFQLYAQTGDESIAKVDVLYDVHLPLLASKRIDVNGTKPDVEVLREIKKGARFYILEYLSDGGALVQFWYNNYNNPTYFDSSVVWDNDRNRRLKIRNTYYIRQKDLDTRTRRRHSTSFYSRKDEVRFSGTSITGGVTILPFKFRPAVDLEGKKGGFEFSKDVQLGLSGGIRQRLSHYNPFYINVLFNVGISSVTMDSYNTRGFIAESTDLAAITFAYGLVMDFDKIQFGLFAGKDRVSDKNSNNWIYQNKFWWSVGFGYSIFNISTKPLGNNR